MEPIEGSETSAFKTQMPGKYPKENILQGVWYLDAGWGLQTMGPYNIEEQ